MNILLNDEILELEDNTTLEKIILKNGAIKQGFAVAVNNTVISRKNWHSTILQDGDKIILVKLACGG